MKTIKTIFAALLIAGGLFMNSCSSDDSTPAEVPTNTCPTLTDQSVQGSFRGTNYVSPAGFYKVYTLGGITTYRGEIYVKQNLNSDCAFPTFEGNQDIILFPLPSLNVQSLPLSDVSGGNTLNFNRITGGVTEVELATCGTLKITGYNEVTGELQGSVIARGDFGSFVNGNFTLQLCDN